MSIHDSRKIEDVKVMLIKGADGSSIGTIEKTSTSGLVDTYTITLTDETTSTFEVTNGNYIVSIEKTETDNLIDTYTITMADGSTSTFTVTNGSQGANENLADIVLTLVAQKDYDVNEHIIYEDVYYIVTQPIQEGDSIVIGTNVEQRKVGDEISSLVNIRVENAILYLPRIGYNVDGKTLEMSMFN